jgi:hypothetical protein
LPAPPITSARRPLPLGGQRRADQQPYHGLGDLRRHAHGLGPRARPEDHLALARIIARRVAGGAFDARDLAAGVLPLRDDVQQLAIQLIQMPPQLVECHVP